MKLSTLLSNESKKVLKKANDQHHWDRPKTIMTTTSFEAIHSVGRSNINQDPGLLELITRHDEVYIKRVTREKGRYRMYLQYKNPLTIQGLRNTRQTKSTSYMLTVKKGIKSLDIQFHGDKIDTEFPYNFRQILDEVSQARLKSDGFLWELKRLMKDFEDNQVQNVKTNIINTALALAGYSITNCFEFNESLWFTPKYTKVSGFKIEFGIDTNQTYHSLPKTITFDLMPKLKTVKLKELGIETAGYYNHSASHSIRKKQINNTIKFTKNFKQKIKSSNE